MTALDAALSWGAVSRLSYSVGLHGRIDVTELRLQVQGRKSPSSPLLLAFASDFHAGVTTDPRIFRRLMDLLRASRPDALLLGGDFVSWNAHDVEVLADQLSRFEPALGKYAVMGNHDTWAGRGRLVLRLERAGVRMLINRQLTLPRPFEHVSICGIDDPSTGSPDVKKAFEAAGPVRIFLTHSPDGILFLDGNRFDVAFAGHTHGGQIAWPDGTPIVAAGGRLSRSHSRGRFDIPGNGTLFVSRGIGCSTVPIRINASSELVLCTLHFAAQ